MHRTDHRADGLLDASLQLHRVRAGRDVLEAFLIEEDQVAPPDARPSGRTARFRRGHLHHGLALQGQAVLQAAVDAGSMLILAPHITQACNDKEQIGPMVAKVRSNPEGLNQPETWLADTGYYSEKNVTACIEAGIEPLIAVRRGEHHPGWRERFTEPAPLAENATPVEVMKHKLKTRAGRAAYALRKQTVEPVFGIIKSVMGFRQFLLRGLENVQNEWTLVCLAWNLKRMAVLRPQ